MKKIFKYIAACMLVGAMVPTGFSSCTDMDGDGIDSVKWEGSQNPQNTSFRNPAWEPSLEAGTVVKGSSGFAAISATTQWAPGLTFYCPALTSQNAIEWNKASDAFNEETIPVWSNSRVNSVSVDFAKTIANANYWLFYTLEGENSIGAAQSEKAPQGPYKDLGQMTLKTTTATVKDPFFIVVSTNFYLCYTTEEGTYIQKVTLKRNNIPTCSGNPTLIAGTDWSDVAIYRASASDVYLFGTVGNEIRYARAENIVGPYHDKAGTALTDGSKGEALVSSNAEYNVVENPMRAILNTEGTHLYLYYNAVEAGNDKMQSGYARKPMFIQPIPVTEDGWFTETYSPKKGWTSPRFE